MDSFAAYETYQRMVDGIDKFVQEAAKRGSWGSMDEIAGRV